MGARSEVARTVPPARRLGAWAVHLLTASGALWGLLALEAIAGARFRTALGWMAVAVLVDGIDGTLARRLDVARVLPHVDGSLLDNLVDYLNYVLVPAWLIHEAGLLPPRLALAGAAGICLASAFQFSRCDAKTADGYFTGFPSYWNVVAFYLLVLPPAPPIALALLVGLAVLVFVPVRYVYPSRTAALRPLTLALAAIWGTAVVVCLVRYPAPPRELVLGSLLFPAYYLAASCWLSWRRPR